MCNLFLCLYQDPGDIRKNAEKKLEELQAYREEEYPSTCDYSVTIPVNQYVFPEDTRAQILWDIPIEMEEDAPMEKVENPLQAIGEEVKKKKTAPPI